MENDKKLIKIYKVFYKLRENLKKENSEVKINKLFGFRTDRT